MNREDGTIIERPWTLEKHRKPDKIKKEILGEGQMIYEDSEEAIKDLGSPVNYFGNFKISSNEKR